MKKIINKELKEHMLIINNTIHKLENTIEQASLLIIDTLEKGNKILLCGNGGSAADAQHIAAELTGRYINSNRKALAAIALTTDSSALTSISNDFGFEKVFSRQIEALAKEDDLIISISTSGNSKNIINALETAKKTNCKILGLSGNNGGEMNKYCDINLIVPSSNTPRIQECHIIIGHIICEVLESHYN